MSNMIKENQDNNHKNNIDPTSKLAKTQNNLPNGKTTMVKDLLAQASQAFFFAPVDKKNSSMPLSSTDIENTLTNEEQEQIINYEYNIEQLDNLENLSNSRHDFANPLAPSNVFNHTHKILQPSPNQYPILNLHQNSLTYSSNIKHYFHESNPIDLVVKSLLTEAASPIAAPITIVPPIATSTTATPIFVPPVPTMPAPTPSPAPASTPTPTPPPAPTSTPPSAPTPTPPPAPTLAPTLEEAKQNFEAAINGLNEAVSQNQNLLSWGLTIFNPSAKFTETDDFEKILKEYQAKDSSENVIAAAEKATETQQQFNAISQEAAQKAAEQAEETAREAEQKAEQEAEEAAQKEAAEKAAQKAAQKAAEQAEQEKAAQKAAEQAEQEKAAQKAAEQAELEEAAQQENDISQPDDENETVDKETAPELVNSSSQEEATPLTPTLEEAKQNFEAAINGLNEAVSQNQNLLSWVLTIFNPSAKFTETDDFAKILKEYQAKDSSENVIAAAEKAAETQQQFNAISQEAAQKSAEQAEQEQAAQEAAEQDEREEAAQKEAAEKAAQKAAEQAEQEKAAQKAAEQAEQEKAAQKAAEQAEQEEAAQKAAELAEQKEAAQQENDTSQPDDENEAVDKETAPELVNSSSQEEATPLTPTLEEAKQNFEAAINGLNEAVSQNQNLLSWGLTIFNPSAKFTETDDFAKILKEYQAKDSSENVIAAAEKATETQQQFNAISQEAAQKAAEQAEETEQKAAEQAEQEKAAQKAAEQAEQEEAAQKAAEQAEQEEAAQKAAEQAEQEKAAQKAAEQEEAAQEAAEKVEQEEAAQKEAAEKAAQEAAEKVEQEEAAKKAEPEKAAYEAAEQVEAEENQQSSDVKDNSNSYLSSLKNLFNFSNNVASNSTIQNGELKMPNKKLDELSEQASILEEKISKIKENVFQLNNKLETESIKLNTAREKIKLIEESDSIIAETFKKFHFYLHENSLNYQANYEGIAKALEQNQPARKTLIATVKEAQAAQQEVNSVNNKLNSTQKILDEFNAQLNEINQKINNESQANDLNDFEVINHQDVITKTPEEVKQKITHLQAELNNTNENLGSRENDYNENLRTINDKSKELPGETKKLINPEDLAAEQQYFQDKANKLESLAQLSSQSDELAGKINLSKSAVTEAENAEVLAQYKTQYLWNFTQPTGYKEAKNNLALKQAELQDLYDQQTVIKFDEEKLMKEIGIEDINIEEIDPKQLDDFQQNYSQIISNIETLSQYKVEVENYTNEKISIEQEITNYQQQLPLDLPLENLSDNASDSSATTSLAPEDHQPQIGDVTSQDNSNIWLPNEHHVGLEDASPEIY